jgi:hypothetical protein
MLRGEKDVAQSSLMEISELERCVAQLDRPVGPRPDKLERRAPDHRLRPEYQPIRYGSQMLGSVANEYALFLGLIPHGLALSEFESALVDRPSRLRLLNEGRMAEDVGDAPIWDMMVFLDAIVRSAAFDVPLAASY